MPAASEQISAGVAPIHFVGAAIQAARCRLLAHRQSMSHRSASRSEGRRFADGRFRYRRSFDIPLVCRTGARTCLDEWQRSLATAHRSLFGSLCSFTRLDKALERIAAARANDAKLIEAKPTPTTKENGGNQVDARLPPSIPDRRYRRF